MNTELRDIHLFVINKKKQQLNINIGCKPKSTRENILTENGRHLWKHTAAELRD